MYKVIDTINGTIFETEKESSFKEKTMFIREHYDYMGVGTKAVIEGKTATIRSLKTEDLVDTLVFYDCDNTLQDFEDWFYGVFLVDNIKKAQWLFNRWFEEYMNSEELMEKTDRYQHIYRRARQYGYVAVNPYGNYGGFGV